MKKNITLCLNENILNKIDWMEFRDVMIKYLLKYFRGNPNDNFGYIQYDVNGLKTKLFLSKTLKEFILRLSGVKNNSKLIDEQINILEKNNLELKNEVENMQKELIKENQSEKNKLINLYGNNISDLFISEINEIIKDNNEMINDLELQLYKLELNKKNIEQKLEKLAEYEEKLEIEEEKLKELNEKSFIFETTKELMNTAYEKMKNSVTPKFAENLSRNIEKFSNGKYKKVIVNDEILVELDNGQRISIEKLSTGTIEQIYLALRLSVIDEISNETLPIILDETFAYYDDERLKETLLLLNEIPNQVIILTCTNREKIMLDEIIKNYNYIEL